MKTKLKNRNDKLALAIQKFVALHYSDKIKKVIVKYNSRLNLYLVKIFISNDIGMIARLSINFSLFSKIRTVFNINNFKVEEVSFMEKFVILDKLKDIKAHHTKVGFFFCYNIYYNMNLHEQISRIQEMMGVSKSNSHLETKEKQTIDETWYNDIVDVIKNSKPAQKVKDIFKDITGIDFDEKDIEKPSKSEIETIKKDIEKNPEFKPSVKSIGNTTLLSGTWKVPSSAPSKADALHSFEKRKSDGVGAKILSQIESKLKELYDKGINPDIYELDIDVDSKNYTVKWRAKIGPSKDGKAYMGLASRGSAGGGADTRAKGQLPKLMNRMKNSGAEDITEFLDFKNQNGIYIRQFFFKYTLPKKYKPH